MAGLEHEMAAGDGRVPAVALVAAKLEGTVRSQLAGEPVRTYHQGQNWVEPPGAHHPGCTAARCGPGPGVARVGADSRVVRRGPGGLRPCPGPLAYTSCNSRVGNTTPAGP